MSSAGQIVGGIVGAVVGWFAGGPYGVIQGAAIGSGIGGMLDPPEGPTVRGPRLEDLSVQSASYGVPLARVYGTVPIVGNIFWLENNQLKEVVKRKKQGGKGGGGQTVETYKYYATFAVALADTSKTGPIAGVNRIWIGPHLVYNAGSDDLETIIASNKFAEKFKIYYGTADQMPDPRMQADIGVDDCPAYRRTAYIVFYDLGLDKYSNSLQAAQVKVELMGASAPAVTLIEAMDTSASDLHEDNYNTWAAMPQFIDLRAGKFKLISTRGDNLRVMTQKYSTRGAGQQKSFVFSDLPSVFRHQPARLDTDSEAYQGFVSGALYVYADGYFYYLSVGAEVSIVKVGDMVVLFRATQIDVGNPTGSPLPVAPIASLATTMTQDVAIFDDEIFVLSDDLGQRKIYVYDDLLALDREVDTAALSALGLSADSSADGLFVSSTEICIFDKQGRSFIFLTHSGNFIARYVIPLSDFGNAAGVSARFGIRVIGRMAAIYNIEDLQMRYYNMEGGTALRVPLADVISAELQIAGIEPADIDASDLIEDVRGYRIAGGTVRSAVAPLQGAYPFDLIPSGYQVRAVPRGQESTASIDIGELGAVTGTGMADVVLDGPSREMDSQLPRKVTIKHLDPARDYDMNEQGYARVATDSVDIETQELPLVLTADEAAGMAQVLLFLRWLERDDYAFTLPPIYGDLEPGDVIDIVTDYGTLPLRLPEIQYGADGVLSCKAKPSSPAIYVANAIGGQGSMPDGSISLDGDSILILLDIPLMRTDLNEPGFVATMAGEFEGWPGGVALRSSDNGNTYEDVQGFDAPGTFGVARGVLAVSGGFVIDRTSTLQIDFIAGLPESVTEAQILSGYNYCAYGVDGRWEIMAAADIALQSDGSYVFSTILRGMKGTEWATGLHEPGDYVIFLDDPDNAFIGAGYDSFGVEKLWRAVTLGQAVDDADDQAFTYSGVNLKPLSPVNAVGVRDGSDNLSVTFNRRSRLADSFWVTGVQPILGEVSEAYEIDVFVGSSVVRTISTTTGAFSYTAAEQTADGLTPGSPIPFLIHQMSATIGRGYALEVTL